MSVSFGLLTGFAADVSAIDLIVAFGKEKGAELSAPSVTIDLDGSDGNVDASKAFSQLPSISSLKAGPLTVTGKASPKKRPPSSNGPGSSKKPRTSPIGKATSSTKLKSRTVNNLDAASSPREVENRSHDENGMNSNPQKAQVGEGNLCHQHRAPCQRLIRCTCESYSQSIPLHSDAYCLPCVHMQVLKPNGARCPYKYCSNTLSRVYSQDMDQILSAGRNLPGVDKMQHCGPDEARYLWKVRL